jgi:glycosyltransferase involved in cell wall biosynthesis
MCEVDQREDTRTLTVLIPCFNEQDALPLLFNRMDELIDSNTDDVIYTILFVDDGSRDSTQSLIRDYAHQHSYVDFIFLSRNFGKEKAMYAGIENVTTDGLVIIDADLQDPPELIPQMVQLWRGGYDDVYARRRSRTGETAIKKLTSRWYYDLLQKVSGVAIQKDTGDFRLLDSKCITALKQLDESERNSKALFSWIGFRKIEFLYDRDPRVAGKTKWNYLKLLHLAMDGITSFTTLPLRFATYMGMVISTSAVVYALVVFINTLTKGIEVPGYASTMVVLLVLGGVQLLSLGIIGEYLGRIFMQTKHRPNYLVQEQSLQNEKATQGSGTKEEPIK